MLTRLSSFSVSAEVPSIKQPSPASKMAERRASFVASSRGVSLQFLSEFASGVQAGATCLEVLKNVILPATQHVRAALLPLQLPKQSSNPPMALWWRLQQSCWASCAAVLLQGGEGCSYLDLVHELPGAVGKPQCYLAYDRGADFRSGLVQPLLERFQSSDALRAESAGPLTTTYIWIDLFCRNHHLSSTADDIIGITQVG